MTRLSGYFLPTERQPPADAEALSHKLGVRAGLFRQVGAGLWSFLPAGWRVHQNAVQIVREELDAIGAQEMLMPVITPADLWKRSGRYDIDEVFKLRDRREAELILALSHEETVTLHVANAVKSYRDLPLILYHFQTKGRDEARPRAGILRTREFVMKDAYTFDRDTAGLDESYARIAGAYDRIFDRCGLEWYSVESDVGAMGGTGAHEYMAPCPAGENDVVLAPGYAANIEVATADPQPVPRLEGLEGRLHTPGHTTIEAVAGGLGIHPGQTLKAFPIVTEKRGLVLAFVRGDHRVNEIKLANALGEPFRPATEDELPGPAGYLGPKEGVPTILDLAVHEGPWVVGANEVDHHRVTTVDGDNALGEPFRPATEDELPGPAGYLGPKEGVPTILDLAVHEGPWVVGANEVDHHRVTTVDGERLDFRSVEPGDTVGGNVVTIEPAIEIGNIFKLGTRYSEPLGATYLDENGKEQLIVMGSYGIGPARITAAAIEQHADDQGISWPRALAPWDVEVVALGKRDTPERAAAEALYEELQAAGLKVLFDDTDAGTGEKFTVAELLGVPLRLTVGRRSLESGTAEVQIRRGGADHEGGVPLEGGAEAVRELWRSLP